MFSQDLILRAEKALDAARSSEVLIVTVETCTAGLLSGCLTSVPGASSVYDRGFVLYHASAKATSLGVPEEVSKSHGAVSAEVTAALAEGALRESNAGVSVAVTGYAGPGGGTQENPVGTIYVASGRPGKETRVNRHVFSGDRNSVRLEAVGAAFDILLQQLR